MSYHLGMIGSLERKRNPQYRGRNIFVLSQDGHIIEQAAWWSDDQRLSAINSAIYQCNAYTSFNIPVRRTVVDWDRGVFWKFDNHMEVRLNLAC